MSEKLLLGIDLGTMSSKGVLCRPGGEVVATTERPHDVSMPRPGWVEHDAEEIWWNDFTAVCSELLEEAEAPVAAVCVSGIGPCFLAAGKDGHPLRPGILYGVDTRASREVEELTERYTEEKIIERCGNPLTSQSVGPKIAWLRRNEPEVWDETRYFFMSHTFVAYRLTGEYVLDHCAAGMCEPLYDHKQRRWIKEWADEVAPGLKLPDLRWPAEIAGEITQEAAEATGLPVGIPVATGTVDAWSEAASIGVREPGDLMVMYGTTALAMEIVEDPLPSSNLWSTAGPLSGTSVLAGGMATSGALTDWIRKLSDGRSYAELTEEASSVPPGSEGLVMLPYFAGERNPISDPSARGVICGLTLRHTRGHLYRAVLEATAFGIRHLLEAVHEAGGEAKRLVAVGGGTKGGLWTQIVSDVIDEPQELPEQTIGAAYGNALLAGIGSGIVEPGTDWSSIAETIEPNPNNREVYDELYTLYKDLYPATRDTVHALAAVQTQGGNE
ncbi:MAG: FGGY-family carbohydrate kinase [Rubrobacteraceae bacterium]|nr:FGGY-family carbohydrate kinase [Rubrobacteraceae bacterium]